MKRCPEHLWRFAIVARVLPSKYSEIRGAIVNIAKTNRTLKCPVNKFFAVQNIYQDTNQTDKARGQKFRLQTLQISNLYLDLIRSKKCFLVLPEFSVFS